MTILEMKGEILKHSHLKKCVYSMVSFRVVDHRNFSDESGNKKYYISRQPSPVVTIVGLENV
jgi:hypothetical protein